MAIWTIQLLLSGSISRSAVFQIKQAHLRLLPVKISKLKRSNRLHWPSNDSWIKNRFWPIVRPNELIRFDLNTFNASNALNTFITFITFSKVFVNWKRSWILHQLNSKRPSLIDGIVCRHLSIFDDLTLAIRWPTGEMLACFRKFRASKRSRASSVWRFRSLHWSCFGEFWMNSYSLDSFFF